MADYKLGLAMVNYWETRYRQLSAAKTQTEVSTPVQRISRTGRASNTADLDRLLVSWDALLKEFPKIKRSVLDDLGKELQRRLKTEIGGTGKVAGWQAPHMGSGGGYVAVRPRAKTYQTTKGGKRYAVGYVTNAIEGGHRTGGQRPGPKAQGYKYRPRFNKAAVPGRWFYDTVRRQIGDMSKEDMDKLLGTIVDGLEGRL